MAPSATWGIDFIAVVWQEDRTGTWQVAGRLLDSGGRPISPAKRISASPTGATDPGIAFGRGSRDLVVAWSDARDTSTEIYADLDVLIEKPRAPTMATYVKRLADPDFAPPAPFWIHVAGP